MDAVIFIKVVENFPNLLLGVVMSVRRLDVDNAGALP